MVGKIQRTIAGNLRNVASHVRLEDHTFLPSLINFADDGTGAAKVGAGRRSGRLRAYFIDSYLYPV